MSNRSQVLDIASGGPAFEYEPGGSQRRKPFTILVVDDSDDGRQTLSFILAHEGFHVLQAATGAEGLRLAGACDLVILDVRLPDMSGLEVCRLIKSEPATALVPVILLSGVFTGSDSRAAGLEGGGDVYLTKPAEPRELVGQVRALLRVRAAELALLESEDRYRRLVEASPDALLVNRDGLISFANAAAVRLLGAGAASGLKGRRVLDLFQPDSRARVRRRLTVPQDSSAALSPERIVRPDGTAVDVEVTACPFTEGGAAAVLVILHDVTARRQLEDQLRQAQKMEAVGQLAGGIAHDFNNLLTVINGFSELLLRRLPAGDPGRDLATQVQRAGERAALLTQKLLAFSRRQVVEPQVLDLNAIVADTEKMLRRLIGEDVALTTALAPGLPRVKADPGQVEQVLVNLCVNARDAMPTGGHLTIETAAADLGEDYACTHAEVSPGRYAMLAVSDTGVGMSDEVLRRAFEPFFTTKGVGKGTGLGLATVYGIVKQAGGHVWVYSEPGRGTTFKVYLPEADAAGPDGGRAEVGAVAPAGTETILLLEDDTAVRSFARLALEAKGYTVIEAHDGDEALRLAGSDLRPIDLLVTDVVMPGLGGREVAGRLKELRPGLKVLYVSGYTDDAVVRHGVLRAEMAFLQKPYSAVALAQKVRAVLDAPAASDVPLT